MRDLYHRSEAVLGGAAPSEVSRSAAIDAMHEARLHLTDWDDAQFAAHASLFYPSYWTNFTTPSHVHHAGLATKFGQSDQQLLVDFKVDEDKKSTILVVIAADHPGLFSRIVGSVAMSGCSIMNARINTRHDGTILDQFRIQNQNREAVTDISTQQRIASLIEQSLAGDISLFDKLREKSSQLSARVKVMTVPPRVLVTNGRSKTHTVIEVNGADRPGLLYQITYHLLQLGLQVNSATVSTYGEKAVDVFYVKDVYGLQIDRPATQEKIKQDLMAIFEEDAAQSAESGR
jgi:[protein-PII] uridylyltransferase